MKLQSFNLEFKAETLPYLKARKYANEGRAGKLVCQKQFRLKTKKAQSNISDGLKMSDLEKVLKELKLKR